ncbi:MAG: FAD-binding oxidoreductase [Hoeflea sp.]|uniref:FAD-binding oxidoreductase n=1 Tax=Hoeflea sp. TaxID=1940281 RepID=UPI003297C28F
MSDQTDIASADERLLNRLAGLLPPAALLVGDAIGGTYQEDRRGRFSATPRFVLRPTNTAEVSASLAACNDFRQPLVVHGGRTGLSGAHRIRDGEGVVSLERMTGVGKVLHESATVLASAGAPLQVVQELAQANGYLFGVDIGARGTATIGGNLATNAGGIRVMRYGMFRAQVAGLETVLADGTILSDLRGLEKDNTGYDLKQLFVGSEGTLGVVTRAVLKLHPKPFDAVNALIAVSSLAAAISLLERLRKQFRSALSAFELMLPEAFDGAVDYLKVQRPITSHAPFYVLAEIETSANSAELDAFSACLMEVLEEGSASDAVISQSSREYQALWDIRDSMADYIRTLDNIVGGDISVPVNRMEAFLSQSKAAVRAIDPLTRFFIFGHLGDGNLHYVISSPQAREAISRVYQLAADHGGSISAEHGIGVDKKQWLHLVRSEAEIVTMRRIKTALDPNCILNRGRIFDM